MRFVIAFLAILLLISTLAQGALVPRRNIRNEPIVAAEQLVPVIIVEDAGQLVENLVNKADVAEPQLLKIIDANEKAAEEPAKDAEQQTPNENIQIAEEQIAKKSNEIPVLPIVAPEIAKEQSVVESENDKENFVKPLEQLKSDGIESQNVFEESAKENDVQPFQPSGDVAEKEIEKQSIPLKSLVDAAADEAVHDEKITNEQQGSEAEDSVRQATQATPAQATTPGFVQQLIQNSPIGPLFNQLTGQNNNAQVASDQPATAAPPAFFNPLGALTNATQQAIQGLQQFASSLGTQFQNTLSSFGGQQPQQLAAGVQPQQQAAGIVAATTRAPGPIQQLVNTFTGNQQQQQQQQQPQPAPAQQPQPGPIQGIINMFTGNNNNNNAQQPAASSIPIEPPRPAVISLASDAPSNSYVTNNAIRRDSSEVNDSFEEGVNPAEIIIVSDDTMKSHGTPVVYAKDAGVVPTKD